MKAHHRLREQYGVDAISARDHLYPFDERTETDEDILAAVSWEWDENSCDRYYESLNL